MQPIIDTLGEVFGRLDNQVEKWVGLDAKLIPLIPEIEKALAEHFPVDSLPLKSFSDAARTYQHLLDSIPEEETTANGYLNLRFYIMLNGFMAACKESLEKVGYNDSLDPVKLVEKSYYKPYFFDRVTYTKEEIIALLEEDIQRLEKTTQNQKGVLLALRIRKGMVLTLTESYCPLHPRLYPLVADLDQIAVSKDPAVIPEVLDRLIEIRSVVS
jgi:hypothetical protein